MDLSSFIPIDRRLALAQGKPLPEQTAGAVLFADLSGFTALTEAYALAFGPQRGAEEMTALLNRMFSALIEHVHSFHGSVVGFSGDAITCWFVGDAGLQAATAALALQATTAQFARGPQLLDGAAPLALKCAVAAGPARRLLVGDPAIQLLDVLAGTPISRAGQLEEQAERGDVLLDAGIMLALAEAGTQGAWRALGPGDRAFALAGLARPAEPQPWQPLAPGALSAEQIRPWLLPAVWERLRHSDSEFLTELRPAVALFARFAGIDDSPTNMRATLTAYVAWVQRLLARHGGSLLQLTLGDKGSYFYAAFGAPIAHGDDAARAVAAAAALLAPPELAFIRGTQIGLAAGAMRAGTYGEASRQTYGALGDAANLGARLMQLARPGQVLATDDVSRAAGPHARWAALPPVVLRGKAQPVPVRQLATGLAERQLGQLELTQRGTLIGRVAERARLEAQLGAARRGQGQVVAITGEAGQGKSRLAAEMVRGAQAAGFQVYGGAAESSGRQSPFLAWRPIWRALLGLPAPANLAADMAALAAQLGSINPETLPRLPLLGPLLGLPLPETRLTAEMDAALRAASLEALLIDCLRAIARHQPVLLVLEDCHWLDAQSLDLLIAIARAIADYPIALLLAYRHDPDAPRLRHVERLPHSLVLHLGALAAADAEALLRERFGAPADPALVQQIVERAEGNPFFLEELSSYVLEHGAGNQPIELPTSLQRLLIARVDQLGEPARLLLKVASVIGRRFAQSELWGVYPQLGPAGPVAGELGALDRQELILQEQGANEPAYLFKHQMTREVVYASLPQTIRARLHEQFAAWLETTRPPAALPLDLLAYHYGQSSNTAKQRQFYRLAGDAAARSYAHTIAAEYFEHLLELTEPAAQPAVLIDLGRVQTRAGNWDEAAARYASALAHAPAAPERSAALAGLGRVRRLQGALDEAEAQLLEASALYTRLSDAAGITEILQDLARIYRVQGDYARMAQAASDSERMARQASNLLGVAQARGILGRAAFDQGDYANASAAYEQALDLFRTLDAQPELPHALLALAMVADAQGQGQQAHRLVEECLLLSRKLGDRPGIVYALGSLGMIALNQADYATARARAEESLALVRELGDQHGMVIASTNLGLVALSDGRWAEAAGHYRTTLRLALELGYPTQVAIALAGLAASQVGGAGGPGQLAQGVRWLSAAARYVAELGIMLERLERDILDQARAAAQEELPPAEFAAAWSAGQALGWEEASAEALAAGGRSQEL